jgi:hypothetical protein
MSSVYDVSSADMIGTSTANFSDTFLKLRFLQEIAY